MEKEPLLQYVLRNLKAHRGNYREISKATGVPYSTLAKIGQNAIPNPGVLAVQALADYFATAKKRTD